MVRAGKSDGEIIAAQVRNYSPQVLGDGGGPWVKSAPLIVFVIALALAATVLSLWIAAGRRERERQAASVALPEEAELRAIERELEETD